MSQSKSTQTRVGEPMEMNQIKRVMALVGEDMKKDASEIDGKPFSGPVLGDAIGKLCAATQACSRAIIELAVAIERLETDEKL